MDVIGPLIKNYQTLGDSRSSRSCAFKKFRVRHGRHRAFVQKLSKLDVRQRSGGADFLIKMCVREIMSKLIEKHVLRLI